MRAAWIIAAVVFVLALGTYTGVLVSPVTPLLAALVWGLCDCLGRTGLIPS